MAMAAATSSLVVGSAVASSHSPAASAQTLESSRHGMLPLSSSFKELSPLRSCSSTFSNSLWSVMPSLSRSGRYGTLHTLDYEENMISDIDADIIIDEFLNSLTSPESIDEDKDKEIVTDSESEDDYAFFDSLLVDDMPNASHEVTVSEDDFEESWDSLLEDDYTLKPNYSPKVEVTPSEEYLEKISSSPNISQLLEDFEPEVLHCMKNLKINLLLQST
ncbi:hypothetical protein L7F22_017752 [Adiantum nelumboides]|nr:hypothetical protein [Adiantum nelumboides]